MMQTTPRPIAVGGRSPEQPVHWPELDGVRTVAFLTVFIFHCGPLPSGFLPAPLLSTVNQILAKGFVGVSLFFVLSGFLITSLMLKEQRKFGDISLKLFYARRALRIWPLYYAVLFFAVIVLPWGRFDAANSAVYHQFLKAVALPFALFVGNCVLATYVKQIMMISILIKVEIFRVLFPLWSLCIEEQFYLCWPVLVKKLVKPRLILALCCAGALLSLAMRVFSPRFNYYYSTLTNIDCLMYGAAAAVINANYPGAVAFVRKHALIIFLSVSVSQLAYCLTGTGVEKASPTFAWWMSVMPFGMALMLLLIMHTNPLRSIFAAPILSNFGKFTYCAYLIHFYTLGLVNSWVITVCPPGIATWSANCALSLTCILAVATLSYFLIESPCNSLRKRFARH